MERDLLIVIDAREGLENPIFRRSGDEMFGTMPADPSCAGCLALGLGLPSPPVSASTADLLDFFHRKVREAAEKGESYSLGPIMGTRPLGAETVSTITCPICGKQNLLADEAPKPYSGLEPGEDSGKVLAGRHRVGSRFSATRLCVAYCARHVLLGCACTVWLIAKDKRGQQHLRAAMLRYGRACARIDDPHTIAVTDIGETEDGTLYLVAEDIDGPILQELVTSRPLPGSRAIDIASQLARALAVAHARGVVHRALSSRHVALITREGRPDFVRILDFPCPRSKASRLSSPRARGSPRAPTRPPSRPAARRRRPRAISTRSASSSSRC